MKTISPIAFILVTYIFSWICWGIAIATGQPSQSFPTILFYILGGSGPSIVALFFIFRFFDQPARKDFWARFSFKRIRLFWWVLTLVVVPALLAAGAALDVLFGGTPSTLPNLHALMGEPVSIPIFLIISLFAGPLSEELGWRGIVLESFQKKWSPLRATLVLAAIWSTWHLPLFFIRGTSHYDWGLFSPMFWLFLLNVLPLTLIMTLAYNHNQRSITIVILIHFAYNLALALLMPFSILGFAITALLLAVVALATLWRFKWQPAAQEPR